MSLIELFIGGSMGATLGLIAGIFIARRMGLTPTSRELKNALEANETYYKTMVGRFKGRLKEYEQPSELQRLAQNKDIPVGDIGQLLANELPNIRGLPRWVRPLIPGIQAYLKENPEQVNEIITKFTQKIKPETESLDYL